MPASARMISLAEQKRILVLRGELQRQIIELERFRLIDRVDTLHDRISAKRWWIAGGLLALGWLTTRKLGAIARWLPAITAAWKMAQNFKTRRSADE